MTPAIVLQASGPNALGLVRCLGRAGVPVIACDHNPRALGLLSRYATPRITRDPLTDRDGFLADLEAIGRSLPGKGVLFPTHDEAIAAIGPHEDHLAQWFHRPWSPWDVMENILDKRHQHEVARSIGFPVPATVETTRVRASTLRTTCASRSTMNRLLSASNRISCGAENEANSAGPPSPA